MPAPAIAVALIINLRHVMYGGAMSLAAYLDTRVSEMKRAMRSKPVM